MVAVVAAAEAPAFLAVRTARVGAAAAAVDSDRARNCCSRLASPPWG